MDVRPFNSKSCGLFTANDLRLAFRINPFLAAIGGHSVVPYSDLQDESDSIDYITLLRNPVKRYLSQYIHWVEKKELDISIQQFMNRAELWNLQTKKIAGSENVDEAKNVLNNSFLAVGVVERFDVFLLFLRQFVRNKGIDIRYRMQNRAKSEKVMTELESRWYDEITKRNSLDIELYNYVAATLIPIQKERYGHAFASDLEEFQRINKAGPSMTRRYIDYLIRKFYIEPVTGGLRKIGGLPYKGSY